MSQIRPLRLAIARKNRRKKRRKAPPAWVAPIHDVMRKWEEIRTLIMGGLNLVLQELSQHNTLSLKQTELLEKVRLTNETAEETIMNVLLAIRQNDALKAWFPAQAGYDEKMVAGPHPSWVERQAATKVDLSALQPKPEGESPDMVRGPDA